MFVIWSVVIRKLVVTEQDSPCEGLPSVPVEPVVGGRCCLCPVSFRPSWIILLPCLLTIQLYPTTSPLGWFGHYTGTISEPLCDFKNTSHRPAWSWWRENVAGKVQVTLLKLPGELADCASHQYWACEYFPCLDLVSLTPAWSEKWKKCHVLKHFSHFLQHQSLKGKCPQLLHCQPLEPNTERRYVPACNTVIHSAMLHIM